ncbi:hypothetical protein [Streptomyces caeruleatus]|uniref:Uncharacterized protein n=1 Tax=Streptomyces caeruleatus TaxID=661399 RepID=A0A101TGE6_9ACTN|nr:hypothetical protein [Streptomyces caeruleatus]KUN91893.1 hypothetical protein AQJ67_41420 [Streptomyces caeruleatus]
MTPNELQMLVCGVLIGVYTMLIADIYWTWRDARRDRQRARAVRRRSAGDRYLNSLRLYQLQQRSRA